MFVWYFLVIAAYSGDNCENERDYCGTQNNVCQNNAICTLIEDDPGYHCNCLDGMKSKEKYIQSCLFTSLFYEMQLIHIV